MSQLTREERLALAVRAQVAAIRAEEAQEWSAFLPRRLRPVKETWDRFVRLSGRAPDPEAPGDRAMIEALFMDSGGGAVTPEQLEASVRSWVEIGRAERESAEAIEALTVALEGGELPEWLGMDEETFERAVEQALKEA